MTETTLLWYYGNNELQRMYKDYMSLEMASFITVGSEKLFYYPQPLADWSRRGATTVAPAIERKEKNTKCFKKAI